MHKVQTRRNARNKKRHDTQVNYQIRMLNRAKFFKCKSREVNKKAYDNVNPVIFDWKQDRFW